MSKTKQNDTNKTMQDLSIRLEALEQKYSKLFPEQISTSNPPCKKVKKVKSDAPKRINGYLLYSKENRAGAIELLKKENGSSDNPKPSDVIKKLGSMWKLADDKEKELYNNKAKEHNSSETTD
tara:strand:+ start:64 stop:432 length:369 start_codon:yes stop_codon:yes gene_type:complete